MLEINSSLSWYDHGYWIRKWISWPSWLPLPLHADHGLTFSGLLEEHEYKSSTKIFLTWNSHRYSWLKTTCKKKIFLIPHPYLTMLAEKYLEASHDKRGTLVFWPHSCPEAVLIEGYIDTYLQELEQLADDQLPISICIHYHDMKDNLLLKRLSKYQVVTAGSPFEQGFSDKLFSLITSHQFATSSLIGSYTPLCEVIGASFFLYGSRPQYVNPRSQQLVKRHSLDPLNRWLNNSFELIFSHNSNPLDSQRYQLVREVMGCESNVSKSWLRLLMILELLRLCFSTLYLIRLIKHHVIILVKGK